VLCVSISSGRRHSSYVDKYERINLRWGYGCDKVSHPGLHHTLIEGLMGHTCLKKTTLDGMNMQIGRRGCAALRTLLQNPRSTLDGLHLHSGSICNECAHIIASGLTRNASLKEFFDWLFIRNKCHWIAVNICGLAGLKVSGDEA